MALLTVTEAAKAVGVSRTTLYQKIKEGDLSRNSEKQIDTADLLRVFGELRTPTVEHTVSSEHVQTDTNLSTELLDMVQSKDAELDAMRSQLNETEQRLQEHREAAKALMSPEDFDAKLRKALDEKKVEHEAKARQWQKEIIRRQAEIDQAQEAARHISEKATADIAKIERRAAHERAIREALESRGFIGRLLNRKPVVAE